MSDEARTEEKGRETEEAGGAGENGGSEAAGEERSADATVGVAGEGGVGRGLRRALVALVAFLVLLELAYLVVGNSFLRGDWGHAVVNRKPEKFTASWEGGWTVLPGVVHFRHLHLRGETRRARWSTHVDSGHMQIALADLARKHFHVTSGRPRGAEVAVDVLPRPETPRPPEGDHRRWTITLGDVDLSGLREVRIDDLGLAGDGSGRGSASFEMRGPMRLDLDRLRFRDATLSVVPGADAHGAEEAGPAGAAGEYEVDGSAKGATRRQVVARGVGLDGSLAVDRFVASEQRARDFFAAADAILEMKAEVEGLGFLDPWLASLDWLDLTGRGDLEVDARLAGGALVPGSRAAFAGSELAARFFRFRAAGAGSLQARVGVPEGGGAADGEAADGDVAGPGSGSRSGSGPGLDLAVHLDDYRVSEATGGAELLDGENLELAVRLPSASVLEPPSAVSGSFRLPSARVIGFAALGAYLPQAAGVRFTGGSGTLTSEVDFDTTPGCGDGDGGCGSGRLGLSGHGVSGRYGDADFTGDLEVDARLPSLDLEGGRFDVSGSRIEVSGASVARQGETRSTGWWARLDVPAGGVLAGRDESPAVERVDAHLRGTARDSVPFVVLMEQRFPKLGWFDRLVEVPNVEVTARVAATRAELRLRDVRVSGGRDDQLEILAEVDVDGPATRGAAFARYRALHAALALDRGERDWKVLGARRAYDRAVAAFEAGRSPVE